MCSSVCLLRAGTAACDREWKHVPDARTRADSGLRKAQTRALLRHGPVLTPLSSPVNTTTDDATHADAETVARVLERPAFVRASAAADSAEGVVWLEFCLATDWNSAILAEK